MLRVPEGAASPPNAEDEEEDARELFLAGGSLIVKSGTPVEMDVVGMADCVEMVPPGVRRPEGVTSPARALLGIERPPEEVLCPLAVLRWAEVPLLLLLAANASNGLRSSALLDEAEALGVVWRSKGNDHCQSPLSRTIAADSHEVIALT